jgi:hypothetical protein
MARRSRRQDELWLSMKQVSSFLLVEGRKGFVDLGEELFHFVHILNESFLWVSRTQRFRDLNSLARRRVD